MCVGMYMVWVSVMWVGGGIGGVWLCKVVWLCVVCGYVWCVVNVVVMCVCVRCVRIYV